MVISWKDAQGEPVLVAWKQGLNQARQDYKQYKISKDQLAKVEENTAKELSQRIQKEISYNEKFFDLADVIKYKQARCLGYSQLVYIIGNSLGLSIKPMNVLEIMTGVLLSPEAGHIASIVSLTDGRIMMVDLVPRGFVSKPFIEEQFTKVGNYRELKDPNNPLGIHRKIQILDRDGFLAEIYTNRGNVYGKLGQHTQALSNFTKAIDLNPKYAEAYYNRGTTYANLGGTPQALSDLTQAIDLNPKLAQAYNNRGLVYSKLNKLPQAISDYNKAIELDPKYAEAYCSRGAAYGQLAEYPKALSDFTKAIELNPKHAKAYSNRGSAYSDLGQFSQAISDHNKAIDLNPNFAEAYCNRGSTYGKLGKPEEAKKDLLKAVELNPALQGIVKKISDHFNLNLKLH